MPYLTRFTPRRCSCYWKVEIIILLTIRVLEYNLTLFSRTLTGHITLATPHVGYILCC